MMRNMLPSSTVENYLKKIYLGSQGAPGAEPRLFPMGQLAAALGVTPGTATTMVKTLAESGWSTTSRTPASRSRAPAAGWLRSSCAGTASWSCSWSR